MKKAYITSNFSDKKMGLITTANKIIADYQAQGYRLTLRQLYYQFVSRDIIPNSERSYKNLGAAISDGRLGGLIDWSAIEDRVRVPRVPSEWESVEDIVSAAIYSYRLPRWKGQDNYVELWVEKDALAGVLQPLAQEFHVTLMVNRGYSSQSAMYEAAVRFIRHQAHQKCFLLYLGDHDPSGEDMVRDIKDRMEMFGARMDVEKLALTMPQVEEHEPPPNPAKMTDSRAQGYVDKHGQYSWEVDALPPEVLAELIRTRIRALVNQELVDQIIAHEDADKEALRKAARNIREANED